MSKRVIAKANKELEVAAQQKMSITDAEKFNAEILLQRLQSLELEHRKAQIALSGFVAQVVQARKLDPLIYGINFAAGRIEKAQAQVPTPGGDGKGE